MGVEAAMAVAATVAVAGAVEEPDWVGTAVVRAVAVAVAVAAVTVAVAVRAVAVRAVMVAAVMALAVMEARVVAEMAMAAGVLRAVAARARGAQVAGAKVAATGAGVARGAVRRCQRAGRRSAQPGGRKCKRRTRSMRRWPARPQSSTTPRDGWPLPEACSPPHSCPCRR